MIALTILLLISVAVLGTLVVLKIWEVEKGRKNILSKAGLHFDEHLKRTGARLLASGAATWAHVSAENVVKIFAYSLLALSNLYERIKTVIASKAEHLLGAGRERKLHGKNSSSPYLRTMLEYKSKLTRE